jgi:CheY-like chemotaxis protein
MASILVIDDDRDHLNVVVDTLRSCGYEVKAANNGEEGLQEIESNDYDLVLTDLMMPKVSGIDVLRQVIADFPEHQVHHSHRVWNDQGFRRGDENGGF